MIGGNEGRKEEGRFCTARRPEERGSITGRKRETAGRQKGRREARRKEKNERRREFGSSVVR
jgi:hypothetical protein